MYRHLKVNWTIADGVTTFSPATDYKLNDKVGQTGRIGLTLEFGRDDIQLGPVLGHVLSLGSTLNIGLVPFIKPSLAFGLVDYFHLGSSFGCNTGKLGQWGEADG